LRYSNKKIWIIGCLLASVFFIFFTYTFLHEIGHGIIGVISGGSIKELDVGINAHIKIVGAKYNNITLPLGNAFGAILPYILTVIIIIFYNKSIKNEVYHCINFLFMVMVSSSMIAWVVIPIVWVYGIAPTGDDVTKFMNNSNLNPWFVSLTALLLILFMLFIGLRVKKVHKKYIDMIKILKAK